MCAGHKYAQCSSLSYTPCHIDLKKHLYLINDIKDSAQQGIIFMPMTYISSVKKVSCVDTAELKSDVSNIHIKLIHIFRLCV